MTALSDSRGLYRLLGVPRTASPDEIRQAFRERAKLYHPDGGGGGAADDDRFSQLKDAYEVLRDPQRRLRYDAEELEAERQRDQARRRFRQEPGAAADREDGLAALLASRRGLAIAGGVGAFLAVAAVAAGVLAVARGSESARLGEEVARLQRQLDAARPTPAAASGPRDEGQQAVFTASLPFPEGSAELDAGALGQAEARLAELRAVVATLPAGAGAWQVMVDGYSARAASGSGVAVDAWELALLRLATVTELLVRSQVPAERVGVRFLAGFAPPGEAGRDEARTIRLRVLCCRS